MTTGARRILFASEYYPPFAPGGAQWTDAAWAAALARRGHTVLVVTPDYGSARRETSAGVTVVRIPFPWKLKKEQGETRWLVHRNPLVSLYFAWWIWRLARAEGVDVVHATGKGALVGSWLAARALGIPVLATIRDAGLLCPLGFCTLFESWKTFDCSGSQYRSKCVGYYVEHYEPDAGAGRRARRWLSLRLAWLDHLVRRLALARSDGVVGVSESILSIYPERVVPQEHRTVVFSLPPSVETPTAEKASRVRRELGLGDGPLVLYAGKLSLGKGTRVLLNALDRIRREVADVKFAFAGKGDLRLPKASDVHALGVLDHATLFPLYRAADVVVVPSVWREPLSRVIVEAMHCGRPVVATEMGGSREAVEDGTTGLLVPARDPIALADAVVTLLRDRDLRERMGSAARARLATAFAEDKIVTSLLDAYAAAERRTG